MRRGICVCFERKRAGEEFFATGCGERVLFLRKLRMMPICVWRGVEKFLLSMSRIRMRGFRRRIVFYSDERQKFQLFSIKRVEDKELTKRSR